MIRCIVVVSSTNLIAPGVPSYVLPVSAPELSRGDELLDLLISMPFSSQMAKAKSVLDVLVVAGVHLHHHV